MTVDPGWPVVVLLAILLLGPLAVGALVGDLVATGMAWREAVLEAREANRVRQR